MSVSDRLPIFEKMTLRREFVSNLNYPKRSRSLGYFEQKRRGREEAEAEREREREENERERERKNERERDID